MQLNLKWPTDCWT